MFGEDRLFSLGTYLVCSSHVLPVRQKTYNLIAFNELAVYSMGWSKSCLLVAFLQFGKNSLIIFTGFFLSFSA
jgi:hypothetical protein